MNRKQNSLMRFSRTERLAQLSEQEIVIEKKKREIQAKIEAQKKKETEEALKKLESPKETKNNKPGFSKKSSWIREDLKKEKEKEKPIEPEKKEMLTNAFSNDGSFLDQFKKLSKTGLGPNNVDIQTLALARKKEEEKDDRELYRQRKDHDRKDEYRERNSERDREQTSTDNINSSSVRKPLDSNIQLQLPPPGVVQLVPQHQVPIVSLVQPLVQNPVSMVPPPSVQIPNLQRMVLNPVPKFTTNEIQLKAISSSPDYAETPHLVPPVHIPSSTEISEGQNQQVEEQPSRPAYDQSPLITNLSNIQPPLPLAPQNIPPPSPLQVQNIPPPPLPPKESELLPKIRTESISMTLKNNPVKKLESIPNPLDIDQIPSPPSTEETRFSEKNNKLSSGFGNSMRSFECIPLPRLASLRDEDSSRISSALNDDEGEEQDGEDLDENHRSIAHMVARCGDDFEDSLRSRHESDPALRFLFEKDSNEYLSYRELVVKYRKDFKPVEEEKSERFEKRSRISNSAKDDEDSNETKFFKTSIERGLRRQESSDSDSCGRESSDVDRKGFKETERKYNDGYQADNEEDLPYYKMPESSSKDCFLASKKQTPLAGTKNENSEAKVKEENSEQLKAEERRKRKRKSRWGDAVATSSTSVGANLNLQPPTKLPAPKTSLLSQLTRSDPGLLQYAKQTFGSTNLSEEDWKKAEDHYKINLLYQDLVKKRAEIAKLEKAGKFKYEYDSDEDVEGGTWEHKLRQQEMMATQLWAEELTRQAAGKHHIGDFLPPEELERFMEKYNAVKEGREPDLSDYKEFKLKEDNVGYRLLQKMGWNEGQGLGQDGTGITNPVNKATTRHENQGLGVERPDGLEAGDDEYDAYRKRMMLAYRFRPNPLNNPRRPYY